MLFQWDLCPDANKNTESGGLQKEEVLTQSVWDEILHIQTEQESPTWVLSITIN